MILHITSQEDWEQAKKAGTYKADTLITDGFIHCSTADQLIRVANHMFKHQQGLVLLSIDENRLTSPVIYEDLYGAAEVFPHIYGSLNLNAVQAVDPFPPQADGNFALPVTIQ